MPLARVGGIHIQHAETSLAAGADSICVIAGRGEDADSEACCRVWVTNSRWREDQGKHQFVISVTVPLVNSDNEWRHRFEDGGANKMELYLTLGGRTAIAAAMERLNQRLRLDSGFGVGTRPLPAPYLEDLTEFFVFLTGGAPIYEGQPVSKLLRPLCPSAEAFEILIDHIVTVLIGRERRPSEEAQLRQLLEQVGSMVLSVREDPVVDADKRLQRLTVVS